MKNSSFSRVLLIIIVGIVVYETIIGIYRKLKRRRAYALAKARAKSTGLPLLVIGDPYNGLMSIVTGPDYGCGTICLDLVGCSKCPNAIKGRLEDEIKKIDVNKYVIYVSCVLEYVDDLPLILSYLDNMNFENLFIVNVEWYSLMAYLYPYFLTNEQPPKYIIYQCPPWNKKIVYR